MNELFIEDIEQQKTDYRESLYYKLYEFVTGVTSGTTVVCESIRLSVQRFLGDSLNSEYFINFTAIDELFNFFFYVRIDRGNEFIPFDPEGWQVFYFVNIYSFYFSNDPKKRRFNRSLLSCSRKNGKTTIGVIQILYSLCKENINSRIYVVSESKSMSTDSSFYIAKKIVTNSPALQKRVKQLQYALSYKDGKSTNTFKMLPNMEQKLNAIKPSFAIIDELATMKNSDIMDKLTSGGGSSPNFLLSMISTRGNNSSYFQYDLEQTYKRVLRNEIKDERTFIMIFEQDSEDEMNHSELWIKSNPSINKSLSLDHLIDTFEKAKLTPTSLKEFFVYNLNFWLESKEDQFIEQSLINEAFDKGIQINLDLEFFRGKEVYIGIDLSRTEDLSSVVVLHYDKIFKQFYCYPLIYFANNPIKKVRGRGIDITQWIINGEIYQCKTNRIDYQKIIQDIDMINSMCTIKNLGYDSYNPSEVIPTLEDHRIYCTIVSQAMKDMSPTTKYLDRIFAQKEITCSPNMAFKWQFKNCILYTDLNTNNIKLNKKISRDSIDSVIALQNAVHLWYKDYGDERDNPGFTPIKITW
jgi:phage terminase large subunit-like protein